MIDPDAPAGAGGTQVTERAWRDADGKERRVKIVQRSAPDGEALARQLEGIEGADPAEREAMLAEMRAELAEADRVLADLPSIISSAMAEADGASASAPRVIVKRECKPGSEAVTETASKDGIQIISICHVRVMVSARKGLEDARDEIAREKDIPDATRKQLLQQLDRQIARWREQEG
jgi:phosphopantetheine adenylyltransferase